VEQFIIGNYIYRFDGKEIVGIFDQSDLGLEKNLMDQLKSIRKQKGKQIAKAWYQDYMDG
jgi:hypothetical protein